MCYSAMVEQDAKRLARQFDAEIYLEMYAELFDRRLKGEKLSLNKAMEIPFFNNPFIFTTPRCCAQPSAFVDNNHPVSL